MKRLIILGLGILLSGCMTATTVEYRDKKVPVTIPAELKKICQISRPPVIEEYLQVSPEEREAVLYVYSRTLLLDLTYCNVQLQKLHEWEVQQRLILENANGHQKAEN